MESGKTKTGGQEGGKRDSFRDWEAKLEDRCAHYIANLQTSSLTLEWPVVDSVTVVRQYRLSDKIAPAIQDNNCRELDRLRKILRRRCRNCDHVVSSDATKSFEVPVLGAVCSLCYDLHKSVAFNGMLRNMNYFKYIQEAEDKRKNDDGSRGGWRDKAGM